jgi:hypothetical protein
METAGSPPDPPTPENRRNRIRICRILDLRFLSAARL